MKNIAVIICLFICAQTLASTKEVFSNKTTNNLSLPIEEGLTTLAAVILQNPDDKFTIRIHIENYTTGNLSLRLISSTTVLHKETVTHTKYARKYDMYNLPVGDYEIEVKNEKEKFTKKLTIEIQNGKRVLIIT